MESPEDSKHCSFHSSSTFISVSLPILFRTVRAISHPIRPLQAEPRKSGKGRSLLIQITLVPAVTVMF